MFQIKNIKVKNQKSMEDDDLHTFQNNIIRAQAADSGYIGGSSGVTMNDNAGTSANIPQVGAGQVYFKNFQLFLDTNVKDSSANDDEFYWSFSNINNITLKNIVAVKVMPFYFPKTKLRSIFGALLPDLMYYRKVMMEITTISSSQSIQGRSGTKFNFIFTANNYEGAAVKLDPDDSYFYLQTPFTTMTDINIRFYVPSLQNNSSLIRIVPPESVVNIKMLINPATSAGYNPARFQIQGGHKATELLDEIGPLQSPGIAVTISGFTSASSALNNIFGEPKFISAIIDDTTFEIADVDTSILSAENYSTCLILKNRFFMVLNFITLSDTYSNFIAVTQN